MSDPTVRAKALLEGVPPEPWKFDPNQEDLLTDGNGHVIPPTVPVTEFIAAAPELLRELVAEVERLRPVRVTTTEELDALPDGSVIRSAPGGISVKRTDKYWGAVLDEVSRGETKFAVLVPCNPTHFPALVLWNPEADHG